MTDIDRAIGDLLAGKAPDIPLDRYDICRKSCDNDKPTILGYNTIIIVAAVILDDEGRFVLIQEAKESCRGKWYLPAGRLERDETLEMGVKREVKEEAGFDFEPTNIVQVESSLLAGYWMRFTFTGNIIGGSLKTEKEADSESLQARWCSMNDLANLRLRARDILPVIDRTRLYYQTSPTERHPTIMPDHNPHKHMCMRIILVRQKQNSFDVLLCTQGTPHFPIIRDGWQAEDSLHRLEKEAFHGKNMYGSPYIICIEHVGSPHGSADGVCLNLLTMTEVDRELNNPDYIWHPISSNDLKRQIVSRTRPGMSVLCP
ncbi:8-oxo-dGDP phosphatase NUDT18-like [Lytechinus variegatus]|uniref:8-oxo-dGDP phosphatase NUDT18-like n=1 Tax=Lytechinus variegatus TaxID=7654 RepID=UPI001BB2B77B|nr:8-oxo-dGDP phosphatase NUDT18-like [Lytechinus variegatus]